MQALHCGAAAAALALVAVRVPAGAAGSDPVALTIPQIQGTNARSPWAGEPVATTGVVTLVSASGRELWLQHAPGDGNPRSSDGILLTGRSRLLPRPEPGDQVRVVATVEEEIFDASLPRTRLVRPAPGGFQLLARGVPLPEPVVLSDLPDESLADGAVFWEALEGMRVAVRGGRVVAATTRFGEFALLAARDARPGSGYFPSDHVLRLRAIGPQAVDYNPERILVDDAPLEAPLALAPGDLASVVGVVDYTFGSYKVQAEHVVAHARPLPRRRASLRSGPRGDAAIATFNLGALFDRIDAPGKSDPLPSAAELATKLAKLALAIERELALPELLVVQEVENTALLQTLGDRVNAAAGTRYAAVSAGSSDLRGIEVGFLWDAERVELLDAFALAGPDVAAAFGPASGSPGREPLVGEFRIGAAVVTVVGCHFKSKLGDDPVYSVRFARPSETIRKAQARAVRRFVRDLLARNPGARVLVAGDLNDFPFGEPGEGADHALALLEGIEGGVPLVSLAAFEREADRYSFVFDGNAQLLDHLLASPALLADLAGVDALHFDAAFPAALADDPTTPLRASDHDPLEARFWLGAP